MNRMHENYNEETMVYRIEQYKKKGVQQHFVFFILIFCDFILDEFLAQPTRCFSRHSQ